MKKRIEKIKKAIKEKHLTESTPKTDLKKPSAPQGVWFLSKWE